MRVSSDIPLHRSAGRRVLSPPKGRAALGLLGLVAAAMVVWLVVIPAARVQAATYTVNAADDVDDGTCDATHCSLREAINAANANPGEDNVITIGIDGPIVLDNSLPAITDNGLVINGSGQRVSLPAPGTAFTVNSDHIRISNLVINGEGVADIGVKATSSADDLTLEGLSVLDFTGDGIELDGGSTNTVRGSEITANGENGVRASNTDNLLIQGNTFSGNHDAQIYIEAMLADQDALIIQNSITSGSQGIVIGASVNATANIDIGLSFDNRNVFRGTLDIGEYHLVNLSAANIDAEFNDWNNYDLGAVEAVICHDTDTDPNCPAGTGPGVVDFDPIVSEASPLPTVTATPTATQTAGAETPTPTVTPTGTVTPGGTETVPLVFGCNPIAWTGSDGTPIATVGDAVSPAGILAALWKFIPATGTWQGYNPLFPDASDLQSLDRLDVVFVCVQEPGTFTRPAI